MSRKRPTIADLRAMKGKRQLTMLRVLTMDEAEAAERAGVDIVSVPPDLMLDRRFRAQEVVDGSRTLGVDILVPPPADFIEGEAPGNCEEQQPRLASPPVVDGRLDPDKRIVGDILGLGTIAKQAGQIDTERVDRGPIKRTKIPHQQRRTGYAGIWRDEAQGVLYSSSLN